MKTKKCSHCNISKNLNEFSKDKQAKSGYSYWCKVCKSEVHFNYRQNNKEQIKIDKKEYYDKNINSIRRKAKKNYLKHRIKYSEQSKEFYKNHPEITKNQKLMRDFGITLEQYNTLAKEQNNVCRLCGKTESQIDSRKNTQRSLSVDHNHVTGKIRGLLCSTCNVGLGMFKDDTNLLHSAINYLNRNK